MPPGLLDELEKEASAIPNGSVSGLICSKITLAATGRLINDQKQITLIGKLKEKATFADLLKQLQTCSESLQITHISGNLNLTNADSTVVLALGPGKPEGTP